MKGTARAVGFLAGALVAAGLAFDLPSLLEPGVALGLLVLGARAWTAAATRGARVVRVRPRTTVIEGEPLELRFQLERGAVRPPGLALRDPLLSEDRQARRVDDGVIAFTAVWPRRGRKELGPTSLAIRDPLGLCERPLAAEGRASVLVLPRIEPIRVGADSGRGLGALGLLAEGAGSRRGAAELEIEIDGLRPYRRGSPASRIHWPTVARTGEMLELRLHAGAGGRPLVVVDSSAPAGPDELDSAVRAAASLAHRLAGTGGCGLALAGESRVLEIDSRLRGWPEAHARLALVDGGERTPRIRGGRSRGAVVFWVTAGSASPPRALGAAEAYLVHPLDGAAAGSVFTVAGCGARLVRDRQGARRTAVGAAA
jgi:uncharacterized protein (DUF58 family)